jgi:hypothetical protein
MDDTQNAIFAQAKKVKTAVDAVNAIYLKQSKYTATTKQATKDKDAADLKAAQASYDIEDAAYDALVAGIAPPRQISLDDIHADDTRILQRLEEISKQIAAMPEVPEVTPVPTPVPTPTPTPTPPANPGATRSKDQETGHVGDPLFDKALNKLEIGPDGKNYLNGKVVSSSAGVVMIKYDYPTDTFLQQNNKGDWWTQPADGGPGVLVSAGTPTPGPTPVPPAPTTPPAPGDALPKLGSIQTAYWNNPETPNDPSGASSEWQAADWDGGPFDAFNNFFDHVQRQPNGDVRMLLSDHGQSMITLRRSFLNGNFLMDATLPAAIPDGSVWAPLWLFNQVTADEIDHEVLWDGLQSSVKKAGKDVKMERPPLLQGNLAGRRIRFGMQIRLADPANAFISLSADGVEVLRRTSADGPMPTTAVNPIANAWGYPKGDGWAIKPGGKWTPPPAGNPAFMTLHGFSGQTV